MENIYRLKGRTENDWSWQIRKKFILYHLQQQPDSKSLAMLNSYSWTLLNSKTLKCRYDQDQVANLNRMAKHVGIYDQLHASKFKAEGKVPARAGTKR
ncbi:hypothetical protein RvY_05955 [Ramazzottius varieornatus]|uniref:XRN2-binding (XTBD) domain-containing protein n=1 Tax=Ramazzottius varieornatus TaxID=947166 RepID=A0A1D1UWW4_RAMVA|nr:hypothetical protein RvY_05955 [Ramazzottius varieornatus]